MIGLMDCNNFFVSCERLFRPDLAKKPVAVLSSNDGCIVSRSQEVKDLGISMGIPYFEVKKVCENYGITLFSSNFPLYRDISTRVMQALSAELDSCDVYSIDEAFFSVPDSISEAEILHIRNTIMQKTGIPVSFGLGATKTIAKAASEYAKKGNGCFIMTTARWNSTAMELSCGTVWGIGRQTTRKLHEHGISTVDDFLKRGLTFARTLLGVHGERLFFELTGTSAHSGGEKNESEPQSLTSTRSFAKTTHTLSVLESAIGYHVAHLGEKLREIDCTASKMTILAAPSRFGDFECSEKTTSADFVCPTNDTALMLKIALKMLKGLYDTEIPYKKAGVMLSGISPASASSPALLDVIGDTDGEVYRVVDSINAKFGNNTVRSGVIFDTDTWRESRMFKSPEYTTQWSEIASVKAK